MAEAFGVAGRGAFYEEAGAVPRDVVQNHLLQVLTLLAADPPTHHDGDAMRDEQVRVLRGVRPPTPRDLVRGQFTGYRDEPGVAADSSVETFAALRLHVDTWRWADVPFLIRAGKRCRPPAPRCSSASGGRRSASSPGSGKPHPNGLRLRLGPDVRIALRARAKAPGEGMRGEDIELVAREHPGDGLLPYERLLGAAMAGDQVAVRAGGPRRGGLAHHGARPRRCVSRARLCPGAWGPREASALLPGGSWWDPPDDAGRS